MVDMAERGSRNAGSDGGGPVDAGHSAVGTVVRPRRLVSLRPASGPQAAPSWAGSSWSGSSWSGSSRSASGGAETVDGEAHDEPGAPGWAPAAAAAPSASALAESVFPFGSGLPFEPDPEAAAFLNAPRRPLDFYVAPFGTPPFGNPPTGGPRSVYGGPLEGSGSAGRLERPEWGPAYPAGA
jgi:hypothetical protein